MDFLKSLPIVSQIVWFTDGWDDPGTKIKTLFQNQWRSIILFIIPFIALGMMHKQLFKKVLIGIMFILLTYGLSIGFLVSRCTGEKKGDIKQIAKLMATTGAIMAGYIIATLVVPGRPGFILSSYLGQLICGFALSQAYIMVESKASYCIAK